MTAVITARIDGILVLARLPFDNSDRDGRHIDSFSYTVGDPFFILSGAAIHEEATFPYGPQFFFAKGYRFDVEAFTPLTDFLSVYDEMYEATPDLPGRQDRGASLFFESQGFGTSGLFISLDGD